MLMSADPPRLDRQPASSAVVGAVHDRLVAILGDGLVGLYVSGSLAAGGFDGRIWDIDMIAALRNSLDANEFALIDQAQRDVIGRFPSFDDRVEVLYVRVDDLSRRGPAAYPVAVISPGEPFHRLLQPPPADDEWLLNWRALRESAIAVRGPAGDRLLAPISAEQTRARVLKDLVRWPEIVEHNAARHRGWQAYAILTVCRGACTLATGHPVSKLEAAEWAKTAWTDYVALIDRALSWRTFQNETGDLRDEVAYPDTVSFVVRHAVARADGP